MKTQQVIDTIVNWLRDYAHKAHVKGFVIGVSGGIDSAVVSTLVAKTGLDTLLLDLPIHQKIDQLSRAQDHIDWLKKHYPHIKSRSVDLSNTFDHFVSTVHTDPKQRAFDQLALANTRSRLRMMTLYYYGQVNQLLVTGTGNKIEDFGVGFFTKYGDGGVDISPIADLTKSQVYTLAKDLDILPDIQTAIPTDGLWDDDKSDEAQMGASYPELEWAMSVYDTHTAHDFSGRQKEVFVIYTRLHKAMQHKIQPIPVCHIPKDLWT